MKIISANLNGIRSAKSKGFFSWLQEQDSDIICLQEVRADLGSISMELINFMGYHCTYYPALKKGYSGVAIYSRNKPLHIKFGMNHPDIDDEGRYLEYHFENLVIASLYLPSGSSGEANQEKKFRVMDYYLQHLKQSPTSNIIICGDWNIAHQEIDLKNWKSNKTNSGFLPEERAWLTEVLDVGYVDSWRTLYPDQAGYTWWSNRANAYFNDVGWRIDYQIISKNLVANLLSASIYKEQKFSDHAPLIVEYDI